MSTSCPGVASVASAELALLRGRAWARGGSAGLARLVPSVTPVRTLGSAHPPLRGGLAAGARAGSAPRAPRGHLLRAGLPAAPARQPGQGPGLCAAGPRGAAAAAVPAGFRSGPARRQLPLGSSPRCGRRTLRGLDLGAPGRRSGSALLRGLQTGGRVSPSAGVGIRAR